MYPDYLETTVPIIRLIRFKKFFIHFCFITLYMSVTVHMQYSTVYEAEFL